MRNMGKAKSAKAVKEIRALLMSLGAIEMTNKPSTGEPMYEGQHTLGMKITEPNAFIMETVAGLLWLKIDCSPDSSVYTVFSRFDNVNKANKSLGVSHPRLNKHSGKFNFHYSSLEDILFFLNSGLGSLVPKNRKVFTTFAEIEKIGEGVYEADKIIFVFDGQVISNARLSIDDAKIWKDGFKNWRGKKILMVDAVACLLSKSTTFQLIIDGELK